jgi:hypothetical protein
VWVLPGTRDKGESNMMLVSGEAMQPAASATCHWHFFLAVAVVLAGCGRHGLYGTTDGSTPDEALARSGSSGGRSGDVGGATANVGGAQGGSGVASGGEGGAGRNTGGVGASSAGGGAVGSSSSGTVFASGGVTAQGGSASGGQDGGAVDGETMASTDALCDLDSLWTAIASKYSRSGTVPPECFPFEPGFGHGGDVILDGEGRLVDDTGYGGTDKQAWLDGLANQRWPCLAGQTIPYSCTFGD